MPLTDAIRCLRSESEVLLLLTAYLENLHAHAATHGLPADAATLPLRDAFDIQTRFGMLLYAQMDAHSAVVSEAVAIFGAAVTRLNRLRAFDGAGHAAHEPRRLHFA